MTYLVFKRRMAADRHRAGVEDEPAEEALRPEVSPGALSACLSAEGRPHTASVEARWAVSACTSSVRVAAATFGMHLWTMRAPA